MFVKIRIRYVFEERFIFGSELLQPWLQKGELAAEAGGGMNYFSPDITA